MSISVSLRTMVKRLLDTYGQPATFSRETVTGYDPVTSEVTGLSTTNFAADVYPSTYIDREVDGETVQTEDTRLLVDAFVEPLVNDTVSFDGVTYRVLQVQQISAQGSDVLYICQVRI